MSVSRFFVRNLYYTDRSTDEEFGLPKNVLDDLYGLFITTKDIISWSKSPSFTDFLNEVFYQLTLLYDDITAPEHIIDYLNGDMLLIPTIPDYDPNSHSSKQQEAWDYYCNELHLVQRYVYTFIWMMLKKHPNPPRHIKFAILALDKQLNKSNNPFYDTFKKFVETHKFAIELQIEPTPDYSMIWLSSAEEWNYVTKDYDANTIRRIINRFKTLEGKQEVIKELKKYIAERNASTTHPKYSKVTYKESANEAFLDELLMEANVAQTQRIIEEKAAEKSKDDRIAELEEQVKQLEKEKDEAVREKKSAERDRDKYQRKLDELTGRLNRKHIPAEFKTEEAKLILNELMKNDIISPLGHNNGVEFVIQCYRWEKSGALFGYFVDKMNFQLELADSGGRINWKPFKKAFSNYEEKEKRARDTVSHYKQHPEEKMPENAEKIDDAIAFADKKLAKK